jgi:hypothetical protein
MLTEVAAQERSSLFLLPGVPQASLENPAFQNRTGKFAIGIPILSGMNINVNSNMALDYLFFEDFDYSVPRLYESLDRNGKLQSSFNISLFFASLKQNKYTFSVSVSERGAFNGNFEKEIVRVFRDGIIDYYGSDHNLGSGFFQFRYYKEVGVGIARELWKGFDIGIRPKLLFGKYFIDTNDFSILLESDMENKRLLFGPDGRYFMSGPLSYDKSFRAKIFPGDYFFQFKNLGFALDAGIMLRTGNSTEWSVSILDIGAIGFGHNVFKMKMARPWRYAESALYQSHSPKLPDYMEPLEALKLVTDSTSFFLEVEDADSGMVTMLPVKFNISGKHYFTNKTAVGAVNQLTWYRRQPVNMASVFAYQTIGTWLEMAGGVTLYNLTEIAPGFNLCFTARKMQLYLATNNILGFINPSSSKHLNLCFGMNFLIDTQ